jgi:putative transposase
MASKAPSPPCSLPESELQIAVLESPEKALAEVIRAFRYPLHPTKAQSRVLDDWLRLCRFLYNGALQHRRDAWRMAKKSITRYDQTRELTEIRRADPEYGAVPVEVLRSALVRLERAFQAFFRRVKAGQKSGYPRFQGRDRYDSFSFPFAASTIEGNRVWIPKMGWVKFNLYRPLKGKPLQVVIKRKARGWDVCIAVELGEAPEKVAIRTDVGIDLGLSSFATLSDGTKVENPRFFKRVQERLALHQRSLAKKKKGSKSRQRAKLLVARAHEHAHNQRQDFQRKLAASLFSRFDLIAHEDLKISRMVHGNLSKSIHDAGWAGFIRALASKAEYAGKWLVPVNPNYTTQACSGCGTIVPKGLSSRVHSCVCGLVLDRDHNAALNVLALGRSAVAVGPKGRK